MIQNNDSFINTIKYIGIDVAGQIQREEISEDTIKQISDTFSSLSEELEEENLSSMSNNGRYSSNDIQRQKEMERVYKEEIIKCIFEYGPDDLGKAFDLSVACGNRFQDYINKGKELPQPIDLFNEVLREYITC